LIYCDRPYGALEGADGLAVLTEWQEFRQPDFDIMRKLLRSPVIFYGRNVYEPKTVQQHGFTYYGSGRPTLNKKNPARNCTTGSLRPPATETQLLAGLSRMMLFFPTGQSDQSQFRCRRNGK